MSLYEQHTQYCRERQLAKEPFNFEEALAQAKAGAPSASFEPGKSVAWLAAQQIDHSQTLLGDRYLCRGGGMFIVAPSGMGKSTLSIQLTTLLSCGHPAFGIAPPQPLRVLVLQAEDDQGDMIEMSASVKHLGLLDGHWELVNRNSEIVRCNNLVGHHFINALKDRLERARNEKAPFDLVIINPYSVFLGADVKDTYACTEFLNQWLNPLLDEYAIGVILIHHTAKTNFQSTEKYSLWDWAYHGAGAACITNWARAILAISPENADMNVFKFIAAKRGRRIGWEGAFQKYFAWSGTPGVLLWQEATSAQIADCTAAKNGKKTVDLSKVLEQIPLLDPELKTTVLTKIGAACNLGVNRSRDALNELIVTGKAFDTPIAGTNGHRSFAGICRRL
jgi:hypothetical protein